MGQGPIRIVGYREGWVEEFRVAAGALRDRLGPQALRIDHIGSTAVPRLAAKDKIDIQLTVADLDAPGLVDAITDATAYAKVKRELARLIPEDLDAYALAKDPVCDLIMASAADWAERIDWIPGPSDA